MIASLLDNAEERPDSKEHHAGEMPGMQVTESATENIPPTYVGKGEKAR